MFLRDWSRFLATLLICSSILLAILGIVTVTSAKNREDAWALVLLAAPFFSGAGGCVIMATLLLLLSGIYAAARRTEDAVAQASRLLNERQEKEHSTILHALDKIHETGKTVAELLRRGVRQ